MMTNKVQVFLWLDEKAWDPDEASQIFRAFKPLKAEKDIKAAIGAGADALVPMLNVLLVVTASVVVGFLNAIGEEIWKEFKQAIAKACKIKPAIRKTTDLKPQDYFEFVWWTQFSDKSFLITLSTRDPAEVEEALKALPKAVDLYISKNTNFSRLFWNEREWKAL